MKRFLLTVICGLLAVLPCGATEDTFENSGIWSYINPPTPPQAIDATNFVNRGYFAITNLFLPGLVAPPLPFTTSNTRNYTNYGVMLGSSGFNFARFDNYSSNRADNFVNTGSVFETNAAIYGDTYLMVGASNIVDRGTLAVGGPGRLSLIGDNIDVARGSIGAVGNETNDLAGVQDWYWGVATNILGATFNPSFVYSSPMIAETIQYFFGTGLYVPFFQQLRLTNGYTAYILISGGFGTDQTVDALILANTNSAITTEVRFGGGLWGLSKYVQWQSVLTNRATGLPLTNRIYLADTLVDYPIDLQWTLPPQLVQTAKPILFYTLFSAATFHPINMTITHELPFFTNLFLMSPVTLDPTLFFGTNFPTYVTNTAYGARLTAQAFSIDPSIAGSTYSNLPGRIEILANKVLDLTRTRIDGESFLRLNSTNHFVGSTNAQIIAPFSDINLATTNDSMTIANLTTPTVPRMAGTIECWSGRWTNANFTGSTLYNVTIIDSHLDTQVPSQINDISLRATNLFISDVFNIIHDFLFDTTALTITSNAPGSPTLTGELNLNSGNLLWSSSLPRLQYLTNYGRITSSNSIYFGGLRQLPWYPTAFNEPYQSFVNDGIIASPGNSTWSVFYESSGTNYAGLGPLSVQATTALLNNGALFATNADITLTADSLLITNHVLQAGRSITLAATNLLTDGSFDTSVELITNKNTWTVRDGLRLTRLPAHSSLAATTVTNTAFPYASVLSTWAAEDRGADPAGYNNNAALGLLVLDGGLNSVFAFQAADGTNAMYIDCLELRNHALTRDPDGNFVGIYIAPGMTVYFGNAVADDGSVIAEKLSGRNNGQLVWVSNYMTGYFSSTNIVTPAGVTNRVNYALAISCDIDSNTNGIVNCMDPDPIPDWLLHPGGGGGGGGVGGGGGGGDGSGGGTGPINAPLKLGFPVAGTVSPGTPAAPLAGTYSGLFYDTNAVSVGSCGYFTATTTRQGRFSARLMLNGRTLSASGKFTNGQVTATAGRGAGAVTLALQLDSSGDLLYGSAAGTGWTAKLQADRLVFNRRTNPYPNPGAYTLLIPPADDPGVGPAGFGFGTLTVDAGGAVTWTGTLADGTKVTQRSSLSRQNTWPLYAAPYLGKGVVVSWVGFSTNQSKLIWIKPAGTPAANYSAGFTNEVQALTSKYTKSTAMKRAMDWLNGQGQAIFDGVGFTPAQTNSIVLGVNNKFSSGAPGLRLSLVPATGAFRGIALDPTSGKPVQFQGVLSQENEIGAGFFLNRNKSGGVYLAPVP